MKYYKILLASAILATTACPVLSQIPLDNKSVNKIADAIFRAEGTNSKHLYGVLIPCSSPRVVCINTIQHAWRDFERQRMTNVTMQSVMVAKKQIGETPTCSLPFIQFLGRRYCPPSVDPLGFRAWTNNVFRIVNQPTKHNNL